MSGKILVLVLVHFLPSPWTTTASAKQGQSFQKLSLQSWAQLHYFHCPLLGIQTGQTVARRSSHSPDWVWLHRFQRLSLLQDPTPKSACQQTRMIWLANTFTSSRSQAQLICPASLTRSKSPLSPASWPAITSLAVPVLLNIFCLTLSKPQALGRKPHPELTLVS